MLSAGALTGAIPPCTVIGVVGRHRTLAPCETYARVGVVTQFSSSTSIELVPGRLSHVSERHGCCRPHGGAGVDTCSARSHIA